jgi:hypothetical protein
MEIPFPFLDSKKARGSASKPWSFVPENRFVLGMVPLYRSARTFFQESSS